MEDKAVIKIAVQGTQPDTAKQNIQTNVSQDKKKIVLSTVKCRRNIWQQDDVQSGSKQYALGQDHGCLACLGQSLSPQNTS